MCECNGTGKLIQLLGAGILSFVPCSCEVAQEGIARSRERMAEFEIRLAAAEQELVRCINHA
ncbi:hypothetical protein [Bacillus sp. OTU530]|uniref:hypothetical protein n=1 Tax=Bacillus sp. OTU530 TaxID=3043862 RepID=UPI00313DDD16